MLHMCYASAMATTAKAERTQRTVVLLGEKERRDLERLARKEKVSSGEIIRRSLGSYKSIESRIRREQEEALMKTALIMLSEAFKGANEAVEKTCARLDTLHLELKKRDIR